MARLITKMQLMAVGTTLDQCIAQMEEVTTQFLEYLGGAPWIVHDDDYKKVLAKDVAPLTADDQGFCYVGVRSLAYHGPLVKVANMIEHDGYKLQKSVEEDTFGG